MGEDYKHLSKRQQQALARADAQPKDKVSLPKMPDFLKKDKKKDKKEGTDPIKEMIESGNFTRTEIKNMIKRRILDEARLDENGFVVGKIKMPKMKGGAKLQSKTNFDFRLFDPEDSPGSDKANDEMNREIVKASKMKDKATAMAHMNKIQKKHSKHGATDTEPREVISQVLNRVFGESVEIDEKYDLYHKDFSGAMQHAYDYAQKKLGITVDPKEIDSKVATGPKKPSEGKTNTYRLKGKGGNLQIQVYNKGGSKPFELNMYKEDVETINKLINSRLFSPTEIEKFRKTNKS